MPTTHKKVIVRKLDRDSMHGYVAANFIVDGKVEILNTSGNAVAIDREGHQRHLLRTGVGRFRVVGGRARPFAGGADGRPFGYAWSP